MKTCIDCGSKEIAERRRCKECVLIYNRQRAKTYYAKNKREEKMPKAICPVCKKTMIMWRKNQCTHLSCRPKCVLDYNKVPRDKKGNTLIKGALLYGGINIPKGYVIHHIDENPYNNVIANLWLMPRGAHNSLHRKLQTQRSLWLKNYSSNDENCWNTIRDHITTAWLETTSANVIKICDIWQPAAEPLIFFIEHGEGSEAMHVAPKALSYGEDMVQTTTASSAG